MLNSTFNHNFTSFGSTIIFIAILLSSIAIIFNFIIIIVLIRHGKFIKCSKKHHSRRIGLVHSINTYIHLIGILSTLIIMCIRTLYGDLNREKRDKRIISWYCHFLAYLLSLFGAGVYGSCFLQALYRFWRIVTPNRDFFQNLYFHIQLILGHWAFIIILLLPIRSRSVYISSDHFCLSPFDDRWTAAYISLITAIIPVTGILILYIKIVIYMKKNLQTKKQWRRVKRDISTIRRILVLVIIILQTSSTGIILWILTFFYKSLHPLFYRLLRLLIILCMIICSITLLMLSPQLKRAFRSSNRKQLKKQFTSKKRMSSNNIEEITPIENGSIS
ncbi:unnamed protein product [Rotaria sordida]|uniref:G-protein coupled receptors family 1 profile domain-containing protein n=1 Tax=Rotaria sordida TaxID=392033 RepID=A0A818Z049_9BILA|nr:unnamed protein product [Rotaria sordida]